MDKLQIFIDKAIAVHGERYEYPRQEYLGALSKVKIICKEHGEFNQIASNHTQGRGCPQCGLQTRKINCSNTTRSTWDDVVKKAIKKHNGLYSYPDQEYHGSDSKITIVCREHGEFKQRASGHLFGYGCQKCATNKKAESHRYTFDDFVKAANQVHNGLYIYKEQPYHESRDRLIITCKEHGDFDQVAMDHVQGRGCQKCACTSSSKGEAELAEWLDSYGAVRSKKIDIAGLSSKLYRAGNKPLSSMELDIYFPEKKIAIEFNGLYWHSEQQLGKRYHVDKLNVCRDIGIDLIQVFEDEWNNKKDIVKSIISTRLGIFKSRNYARKTKVVNVSNSDANIFYNANHIQGKAIAKEHYGLVLDDELIAMASFGNRASLFKNSNDIELVRFCTKLNTQVIGGLSKLLSIKRNEKIKTFCDLRLFNGNGYKSVGFMETHKSKPSYYYFKNNKERFTRFNFQKHKLNKALNKFDDSLSESDNMIRNGYLRIFDCGNLVMTLG